jgi:hypothetical protein
MAAMLGLANRWSRPFAYPDQHRMLIKLKFSGWIAVLSEQRLRPLHTVAESIHKQGSQLLL